jgi:parallel beta-helix repeat protein
MHVRTRSTLTLATGAVLVGAVWLSALVLAGPLNPPAGPVASTYKTLSEVEPRTAVNLANTPGDNDASPSLFKITQPGSYYLTGNITGVAGKHGIEITSSGVTLDLNGFDLVGVAGMGAFDGVSATASSLTNIAVLNGSVRNWGDEGVDLGTVTTNATRVERIAASGNAGNGVLVGDTGTISACAAYSNVGSGMSLGNGCVLKDSVASFNQGNGIVAVAACFIQGCSSNQNGQAGISAGTGATVAHCVTRFNGLDGISAVSACLLQNNTSGNNGVGGTGAGIRVTGGDNRLEGNNCTLSDIGIDLGAAGNIVVRNTCSGNTSNWSVVAGNFALVISATPSSAGFSGNSGGTALGSTDPNANFSY